MLRKSHFYPPQKGLWPSPTPAPQPLCPILPLPSVGTTSPQGKEGLLVVGSEASAGRRRGPFMLHGPGVGTPPPNLAGSVPHGVPSAWVLVS